jgi:hypothetical protein
MADDPKYPRDGAGFKDQGAGKNAAAAINLKLAKRQAEALDGVMRFGPATADFIALKIGRNPHATRPRFSELERKGLVVKLDERGASAFGSKQHVYRPASPEERAVFNARQAASAEKKGESE